MRHDEDKNLDQHKVDIVWHLSRRFEQSAKKNRSFSLRAFAKQLGLHHASLSHIMSRKRKPTIETVLHLAYALCLTPTEMSQLSDLPTGTSLKSEKVTNSQNPFQDMAPDIFEATSEWYHDAILELARTTDFVGEIAWIAKQLNLQRGLVTAAVDRLLRLDLLEIKEGKWIDRSGDNSTELSEELSSSARRKYQSSLLDLSKERLLDTSRTVREHRSMMMTVDPKDIPEIRARIQAAIFDIYQFSQRKTANPKLVYVLQVSAFPVCPGTPQENEIKSVPKKKERRS